MMQKTVFATVVVFSLAILQSSVHVYAQQASPAALRLQAMLRDAETAAGLFSSGRLFYNADDQKQEWGQYCRESVAFANRGEFRQAVRSASKALFLGQNSNNATALAYATRDLAYAYSLAGDLERSEEWAKRSLTHLARSRVQDRSEVLVPVHKVLGDVAVRRNDFDAGIRHYQTALAETRSRLTQVPIRISIANAEIRRGRNDAARQVLDDIGAASETWAPFLQRARGQLAFAEGNHGKAVEHHAAAIAGMRNAKDRYHLMWMQHGLARAYLAAGDRDKALAALREALSVASRLRTLFRSAEFRTGFFGDVQSIYDDAVGLLVDAARYDEALALSEESRARALLDVLRGHVQENPVDTQRAVAGIPPQTAVAVYHTLPDRTVAWTVRQSGVTATVIPAGRRELAVVVERFRRSLSNQAADAADQAGRLYSLLVQPLGLQAGETLVVVPHRALHFLPMQALAGPQGYLIEERPMATVPSLNAMLAIVDAGDVSRQAVLFAMGNPDLGEPGLALPGAEREVREIGALYSESRVFVRTDASKLRFLEQAPGNGVIHVAAHATVDEIDPLYSSIRLAGAGPLRGNVEAHEILKLDLSKTRLVTLSACESGLGKVSGGDEFYGFQRTFLAAGARSLVLSLWQVEDEATARLMTVFYRELQQRPMIEAFQRAQLALISQDSGNRGQSGPEAERGLLVPGAKRAGGASMTHPYFWAPFVLVGDWR